MFRYKHNQAYFTQVYFKMVVFHLLNNMVNQEKKRNLDSFLSMFPAYRPIFQPKSPFGHFYNFSHNHDKCFIIISLNSLT
ncbi:hypothetical protein EV201_2158 [Ancylomarina subtilis]|uniref:Uncharacterized protein n=1 Tax=Ancylomarina subtilis TaxID=1639035 RepID=A0A4Q7VMZ3_9BACT|nr:hypothetical protein EV201_2158 [Ancylomarina subtilis]